MSFLKKLFAKKESSSSQYRSKVKAQKPGTIDALDNFGRKITITRDDWLNSVLLGNLDNAWDDPEKLADFIVSGLKDDFFQEIEHAAIRLCEIDPEPARAVVYLAIIYLHSDRPKKAEIVLRDHITKHGEEGVVLTNLAKAQSAQGKEEKMLKTLWRGLELDPNQDNAVGWYEIIYREKDGEQAGILALERIASIVGSWRAQLWLARKDLSKRNLESALVRYEEALSVAGEPAPHDLLMQMSGDLGNAGHLNEILQMVAPRFEISHHGIQVGNNLIKAFLDTGQIDSAHEILKRLRLEGRMDWQDTLSYWDEEIGRVKCDIKEPVSSESLKVSLLALESPLIYKSESETATLFPSKSTDAPRVAIIGGTMDTGQTDFAGKSQPSDNPGRFCRALPLFIQEFLFTHTNAKTRNYVTWIENDGGGFLVSGKSWSDTDASNHARNGENPCDFGITTHLIARGENWTIQLRILRTIDAKCLFHKEYQIAEWQPHTASPDILQDIMICLSEEAGLFKQNQIHFESLEGRYLDEYMFRLEQSLAVRCHAMNHHESGILCNPGEIILGMMQLSSAHPNHLPIFCLLLNTLSGMHKSDPELARTFKPKLEALFKEVTFEPTDKSALQNDAQEIWDSGDQL